MPTQPTRDRKQRSLEELLRTQFKSIYLVHRLDTGASGVVVFARTRDAAASLSGLFSSRAIRKTYLMRVEGTIPSPMTIESPIGGKEAVTKTRPRGDVLIEAEIETGRTHQIRVHLASIGHPVVGDRRYGGPKAPRPGNYLPLVTRSARRERTVGASNMERGWKMSMDNSTP